MFLKDIDTLLQGKEVTDIAEFSKKSKIPLKEVSLLNSGSMALTLDKLNFYESLWDLDKDGEEFLQAIKTTYFLEKLPKVYRTKEADNVDFIVGVLKTVGGDLERFALDYGYRTTDLKNNLVVVSLLEHIKIIYDLDNRELEKIEDFKNVAKKQLMDKVNEKGLHYTLFFETLYDLQLSNGLSNKELASTLLLSEEVVNKITYGDYMPTEALVDKIAETFKLDENLVKDIKKELYSDDFKSTLEYEISVFFKEIKQRYIKDKKVKLRDIETVLGINDRRLTILTSTARKRTLRTLYTTLYDIKLDNSDRNKFEELIKKREEDILKNFPIIMHDFIKYVSKLPNKDGVGLQKTVGLHGKKGISADTLELVLSLSDFSEEYKNVVRDYYTK